ncbi:MAG TPA: hypothetical protein VGH87_16300 [Polyangiaceae bacterium]
MGRGFAVLIAVVSGCGDRTELPAPTKQRGGADGGTSDGVQCELTQPTLLVQEGTVDEINNVQVMNGALYFTTTGGSSYTLWSVPLSGGQPTMISGDLITPAYAIGDGMVVYVRHDSNLWAVPLAGGTSSLFAHSIAGEYGPITALSIGFVTVDMAAIRMFDFSGNVTTVAMLPSEMIPSQAFAMQGSAAYLGTGYGLWFLEDGTWGGVTLGNPVFALAVDSTDVYFTVRLEWSAYAMVMPRGGTTPTQLIAADVAEGCVAIDAVNVYFGGGAALAGDVLVVDKVQRTVTQVGSTPVHGWTTSIATDDKCIYWGTQVGELWGAPKP